MTYFDLELFWELIIATEVIILLYNIYRLFGV